MRTKLWAHLCEKTRELTWVGCGESCNWCDVNELRCEEELIGVTQVTSQAGATSTQRSPRT